MIFHQERCTRFLKARFTGCERKMNLQPGTLNLFPGMSAISVIVQVLCQDFVNASSAEDGDAVPAGMMTITCAGHAAGS